jgi:hypothetical protein
MIQKSVITERREEILASNKELARRYYDETNLRNHIFDRYGVAVTINSCSDGRVDSIDRHMGLPLFSMKAYRNIGGKFKLGAREYTNELKYHLRSNIRDRKYLHNLFLSTYHYSPTHADLCCRGFNGNVGKAREYFLDFTREMRRLWMPSVYSGMLGYNTDNGMISLESEIGQFSLIDDLDMDIDTIYEGIRQIFPDAHQDIVAFLRYMILGNKKDVVEKHQHFTDNAHHQESILCVGRRSSVIGMPHEALCIGGTFGYNVSTPIQKSLTIIKENFDSGRIEKEKGIVLMSLAEHEATNKLDTELAQLESLSLADRLVQDSLALYPDLVDYFIVLPGIVDIQNNLLSFLPFEYQKHVARAEQKIKRRMMSSEHVH